MKLLITGTCRDIEKYWANTKKSLDIIFKSVEDYFCILVESNSSDNTLKCLNNCIPRPTLNKLQPLAPL
jgi:hypothetical protein